MLVVSLFVYLKQDLDLCALGRASADPGTTGRHVPVGCSAWGARWSCPFGFPRSCHSWTVAPGGWAVGLSPGSAGGSCPASWGAWAGEMQVQLCHFYAVRRAPREAAVPCSSLLIAAEPVACQVPGQACGCAFLAPVI